MSEDRRRTRRSDAGTTDIVHVSSVHPWTDNRIHYREAASLARVGYRVALVAVESDVDGEPSGVEVLALPRLRRARRVLTGSPRAIWAGLKTGARAFHLHDPELIWAIPLLRMLGKVVVYDAHEDLPEQVRWHKPYLSRPVRVLAVILARILVGLARTSSHIITATDTIAKRYPPRRTTVIRNLPVLRAAENAANEPTDRDPAVVYIGGIGIDRGARVMVESAASDSFPSDWTLRLAGTVAPNVLDELSRLPGWDRTEFLGQLSPGEARDLLLSCRLGLVLFQATPAHEMALPTKFFEYLAAGLPLIASDFPLWRELVGEVECGAFVDETSPGAIADAIRAYADHPSLLTDHSKNARQLAVEDLNWKSEEAKLQSLYGTLVGNPLGHGDG